MKNIGIICVAVFALSCSCGNKNKRQETVTAPLKSFTVPNAPSLFESPDNHAGFYAQRFWDNMDFRDTAQIWAIDDQNVPHYLAVLRVFTLTREQVASSINSLLDRAEAQPAMYLRFVDMFDKYLDDPNSQLRHEENYIIVLNHYLQSDVLSDVEKERYRRRLDMAMKNRPGDKAADFRYTLADGREGTLHSIKAEYTLLFISNPGCTACREITQALKEDPKIGDRINRGQIKVLVIYPDENLGEWRAKTGDIPAGWINAYDRQFAIRNEKLYDTRAIPTLYLLDRDKRVLIKDFFDVTEIENYFAWNTLE